MPDVVIFTFLWARWCYSNINIVELCSGKHLTYLVIVLSFRDLLLFSFHVCFLLGLEQLLIQTDFTLWLRQQHCEYCAYGNSRALPVLPHSQCRFICGECECFTSSELFQVEV